MNLKINFITPPCLNAYFSRVPLVAYYFGQKTSIAPIPVIRCYGLVNRLWWDAGPHFHIFKKVSPTHECTHAQALSFTLVYIDPSASNASSPSVCQASGTPSAPQSNSLHLTKRGQGPCPLTLVCQLHWQGGGDPRAHQLGWQVQAGKGLPSAPFMPISACDGHWRWGPQRLSQSG
jgi:hypothetical protein